MFKINKLISIVTVIAISTTTSIANAKHNEHNIENNYFYSTAKVINIDPIINTVEVTTPRRECWEEEITRPVYTHNHNNTGNVIFGGLVGGIVGNQFGRGRGKTAATVVGSIIGATIGNNTVQNNHRVTRSDRTDVEHHCRVTHTTHSEQTVEGYWVTYRYKGEIFTTRLDEEPGKHLKIRVHVTPIVD